MKPGPITSRCFPSDAESSFYVEIVDLATDELVDRTPVRANQNELEVYNAEVARCEILSVRDADFEPIAVRLLLEDIEWDRKEITKESA